MTIALIDYGAGNVPSVERALQRLSVSSCRVNDAEGLANAKAIILPGVGHYAAIIRALNAQGLRGALIDSVSRGVPFLGICLGLQALYEYSEEAPSLAGLGVLEGVVKTLPHTVKLPHMGWNGVRIVRDSPLMEGLSEDDHFYFAHTYAAVESSGKVVATCEHGAVFAAVIESGRVFATQFHPEKSGAAGGRLLQNFVRLAA